MQFKKGINTFGLKQEIICIFPVVDDVFKSTGIAYYKSGAVITSGTDGKHTAKFSRHYIGMAIDLRIWQLTKSQQVKLCAKLRAALTKDYYVRLERDHIHISYKPYR